MSAIAIIRMYLRKPFEIARFLAQLAFEYHSWAKAFAILRRCNESFDHLCPNKIAIELV